jgi:hypothetical protein
MGHSKAGTTNIYYTTQLKCARARVIASNLPLIKTASYNLQNPNAILEFSEFFDGKE